MALRLYNTMGRKMEEFKPIVEGQVGFYGCGPTVYNYAHIGNLRAYVFLDVLDKTLTLLGYKIKHVMNITDVGHLTDDGDNGEDKMKKSAAVYNKHKYLKICAREKISYELVCNLYNDVVLMPDMVLSMNESNQESVRSGCLLCLRNDIEKTLDLKESNKYLDELKELFHGAVCITDTDSSDCIPIENRNAAINEKLDEFRSAELVVTDRLHGMIFSAITGTPCIVLNSKSHKITGCYEWIKHLDYITLYKDKESIFDLYNQIPKQCNRYNNDYLQPYFSELKKYIMDMVS